MSKEINTYNQAEESIVVYRSADNAVQLDVQLADETVWLTQQQMAELYQKDRTVITRHINNIFADGELEEKGNVQILHFPNSDKPVKFVNFVMSKIKSLKISKSHRIFEMVIGYVIQGIGRRMTQLAQLAQLQAASLLRVCQVCHTNYSTTMRKEGALDIVLNIV